MGEVPMGTNQARAAQMRSVNQNLAMREWLDWLTRVRLLLVALILAVGVIWPRSVSNPRNDHYFLPLIVFWITLGTIHIIFLRWIPNSRWLGALQVVGDMAMVSVLIFETGLHDSYFVSMYLLVIIVGSILFSRVAAFSIAGLCALILGALTVLSYAGKIPHYYAASYTQE